MIMSMRTLRIIVAGAGLCLVVVAVAGYRLAGAAETPSLGEPIVVRPGPTTSTAGAMRSTEPTARRPGQSSASSRVPPHTAAPVSPPPLEDAGDDDPDDGDDVDGD
jgi:hypothetical protein